MSATVTQSRAWSIALWVIRVHVAIPFFIAAWLEGMSSRETLAALDLVWIPDAPLWLVRVVAGIEGLAALGLILPSIVRLPPATVTVAALVLLVIQIAALRLDLAAGTLGVLPVKVVVLVLTGAGDRLLPTNEITQTAVALSALSIPAIRVLMADTGHSVSDEGIAASRDFLTGVLQTEVTATA